MTPIARIPRTRGAFSGVLLVLLGVWMVARDTSAAGAVPQPTAATQTS